MEKQVSVGGTMLIFVICVDICHLESTFPYMISPDLAEGFMFHETDVPLIVNARLQMYHHESQKIVSP
jgi:hypothetical protein